LPGESSNGEDTSLSLFATSTTEETRPSDEEHVPISPSSESQSFKLHDWNHRQENAAHASPGATENTFVVTSSNWQEWDANVKKGSPATLLEEKVDVEFFMIQERHINLQLEPSPQPARRSPPRKSEATLPSLARNISRSDWEPTYPSDEETVPSSPSSASQSAESPGSAQCHDDATHTSPGSSFTENTEPVTSSDDESHSESFNDGAFLADVLAQNFDLQEQLQSARE
jgi:hypothetical protein